MTRGFSLVEVVVALVILQVGVLATMTLTVTALDTLRVAEEVERAVTAIRLVADSLERESAAGTGTVMRGPVTVRWRPAAGGATAVDAEALVSGRIRAKMRVPVRAFAVSLP
jgi:prepilin-type N-terminal cleavage/methylation domain-containing protein